MRGDSAHVSCRLAAVIVALCLASACSAQEARPIHLDAKATAALISERDEITLLDVRTPEEFAEGHIEGAVNIDVLSPDFESRVRQLDLSKPHLVYCRSGNRSARATDILEKLGARDLYHLDGGIKAWRADDLPVSGKE
ncbi:rhodanese-like domain-containing protein [Parvularcula sp. LCG005]|uniref:rhodanese-like domain-containing protein n=1 Tax=Parvularcula sp. LCG005 TaxID=3078805 RepID=UPI00294277A2|nr:rhodanese-like domain-containing protein [Parvularcula sp. LCG005]WOI52797.1 rhodanese-like domain-containing protein [Parvularcula sp. LCG005]